MKYGRYFILLLCLLFVACSGLSPEEAQLIGKWEGLQTTINGTKVPATWEFQASDTLIINPSDSLIIYEADWSMEGNRIFITTEIDPENPTYRDVEFIADDTMKLTKGKGIEETWQRIVE